MDLVACSANDEFYTPEYAILPLIKYIKLNSTIWCPFDDENSNFVKLFKSSFNVIFTHLNQNKDFFAIADEYKNNCDYIISNPPYTKKGKIIEKLFQLGKPFAMLVGVVGLFESQDRFNMFKQNEFEIMYFNKRISYFKNYADQKPSLNPPFSSVFLCKDILPKKIMFEEICK